MTPSPDGTSACVKELAATTDGIFTLDRAGKEGLGKAYVAGFQWALERPYRYIFEMDADFSHDPRYLPDFLAAIEENDLVIGSRYKSGVNVVNWPMSRLLLSYCANAFARFVTGIPVKDATGGFKCFRRDVLEALDLHINRLVRLLIPDRGEFFCVETRVSHRGDSHRFHRSEARDLEDVDEDHPRSASPGAVEAFFRVVHQKEAIIG